MQNPDHDTEAQRQFKARKQTTASKAPHGYNSFRGVYAVLKFHLS